MIIDTHIHLDNNQYIDDVEEVIKRAVDGGVGVFVIPGADPEDLPRAQELAHKHSNIYYATGVHPYDCQNFDEELIRKYAKDEKCIAIGECGLDYFRLDEQESKKELEKRLQKEVFIAQIRLANEFKKPLIVHIRDASHDARVILEKHSLCVGVLHCFNADEELLVLAKKGFYFGIGGVITFKNARKLVNVLPKVPKDRLVLETDGPYLTPQPYRGKRNEPLYTTIVRDKIAQLLNIEASEVEHITTQNAKQLFGLNIY